MPMEQAGRLNSVVVSPSSRIQAPQVARTWAVGQVLSATVLSVGTGGVASTLQLAGDSVQAQSRFPLEAGQTLRLQVTHPGPPAVLQILGPDRADDVAALAARVLRSALPLQRPLGESLAALQRLSDQPHSRHAGGLPDAARALLSDLLASLPQPRDAGDGARLAAMVRASGLFFEAEQARQAPRPSEREAVRSDVRNNGGADFKARVAAVAEALRQAVEAGARDGIAKEADSAVRAVIARIETNQALSARSGQEQASQWRMDLPFSDERGPQAVGLRICREGAGDGRNEAGEGQWVVELDVHPPGSPRLHARVSLAGDVVHTLLTTDDDHTLQQLQAHSGELERRLASESLQVGGVRCRFAAPPADEVLSRVDGLVDERA